MFNRHMPSGLLIASAIVLGGCATDPSPAALGEPMPTVETPTVETIAARSTTAAATATAVTAEDEPNDGIALPRYSTGTSEYIFNQNALHTFELTLTPEALATIDGDPAAEEYVEGSLTFDGETVGRVGIRYKGSVGAFVGCLDGSDAFNPSGAKSCSKLSMKVKINWVDTDDTFYGLKKLQFHSQNLDPSQMRERLGYWLFREMGVPAPRSVHARLVINGEFAGLFALTEQIDGRFTRENFDDGTGNLYKEVWPVDMKGQPLTASEYLTALKTNEDEDPAAAIIQGFGQALADAQTPAELQAAITANSDVEELLSYVAVDRTIRHDDGPFHWYCFGEGFGATPCSNHNYYVYEQPDSNSLHLIAWDLDNAFENIARDANPITPVKDGFGETSGDCEPFAYGSFGLKQFSASCEPFFGGLATFTDEYNATLEAFLDGPFAVDLTDAMLDAWSTQIADTTTEADEAFPDAISVTAWKRSVDALRSSLDVARTQAAG